MAGKKYLDSIKNVDVSKTYELNEAVAKVVETAKANFDETIELHVRLGVDPRQADQQVRGTVVLPNGTGKKVKVLVIAKGDQGRRSSGCRRRRSGRRRNDRQNSGRLPRFRRGYHLSRYDGAAGPRC